MKSLLEHLNISLKSIEIKYGQTPLVRAAKNGQEGVIKLLLEREDINPNMADSRYCLTPLYWAALCGYEGVAKLLLEREDVNPNTTDTKYSLTPLHLAAEGGHDGVVKLLLAREDLIPIILTPAGKTALEIAVSQRHHRVVRLLSQHRLHFPVSAGSRGAPRCFVSESSGLLYCCLHHFSSAYSILPRSRPHLTRKLAILYIILSIIAGVAFLSLVYGGL